MKTMYFSGVSLAVILAALASPAHAQTQPDATPLAEDRAPDAVQTETTTVGGTGSDSASAQATAAGSDDNGEIVVTATRRAENLQDVSLSIAALAGDDLVNSQINDILDFAAEVPNVTVTTQLGRAVISIRGMGQSSPLNGRDPSVALHVDGAVISQSAAQLGAFFDLERVEVLRGPQGTLYGRNATGGVVNLITNKPTKHLSGYVRATAGNYDAIGVEGAVSGPLMGEKLLGRVAVRTEDRSGLGINEMSSTDINDVNSRAVRAQLEARPNEDLSFLLSGEYYRENDANYVSTYVGPGYPVPGHPALAQRGANFSPNPRNIRSEAEASNQRETWALTGTLDWKFSDAFGLRSLTNYRELINDQVYDFDTSPVVSTTVNNNFQASQQFSEEVQFNYDTGPANAMLTFYYFKESYEGDSAIGTNPIRNAPASVRNIAIRFSGDVDIESWAVFGNVVYQLTPSLTVDVGARYTSETRRGDTVTLSGGTTTPFSTGATSTDFSPKLTMEYRPFDGMMTYATYSEGFKSGVIPIGAPNPIVRPERVKNYEAGFKSTWFDRKLLFNASVFYDDYTDLQVSRSAASVSNAAAVSILLENAAEAVTKGFEIETVIQPTRAFSIDASVGRLDAKFRNYATVNPLDLPNAVISDLSGNVLPNAPKWTLRLAGHYDAQLGNGATLSFNAGMSYKSKFYFSTFEEERLSQDALTLFDANIRYTAPDDQFFANLWTKNLGDEDYYHVIFLNSTSRQLIGQMGDPRTYGVTVGFNF